MGKDKAVATAPVQARRSQGPGSGGKRENTKERTILRKKLKMVFRE